MRSTKKLSNKSVGDNKKCTIATDQEVCLVVLDRDRVAVDRRLQRKNKLGHRMKHILTDERRTARVINHAATRSGRRQLAQDAVTAWQTPTLSGSTRSPPSPSESLAPNSHVPYKPRLPSAINNRLHRIANNTPVSSSSTVCVGPYNFLKYPP